MSAKEEFAAVIRKHIFGDDTDIPDDECNCCAEELLASDAMKRHDAEVVASALQALAEEAGTSMGWLDPGDAIRAARWIRRRADLQAVQS